MAVAAIAAVGCLAGVLGLRAPESESQSALTLANIQALTNDEVQKVQGFEERVETTEEHWDYENWTYSAETKIDCKGKGETKCP